jgi:hypothetical protein
VSLVDLVDRLSVADSAVAWPGGTSPRCSPHRLQHLDQPRVVDVGLRPSSQSPPGHDKLIG